MTNERTKEVVAILSALLAREGVQPVQHTKNFSKRWKGEQRQHLAWMLSRLPRILVEDPLKAQRWLGFIQGVGVVHQLWTLDELIAWNEGASSQFGHNS